MRIVEKYSHIYGLEFIQVHMPKLWEEITFIIESVDINMPKVVTNKYEDAPICYVGSKVQNSIENELSLRGWQKKQSVNWGTGNEHLIRQSLHMCPDDQKSYIENRGETAIYLCDEMKFVKDRIAIGVQFGRRSSVAYDLFVKHMAFYVGDKIDVGVEILPMKELQAEMSSGIGFYEGELYNVIRQGRGVPAVPLVLVGVAQ